VAAETKTLHLKAENRQAKMIDLAPPGASLGDEQVLSGTLARDDKPAGSFGVTCTWVGVRPKHIRERCDGWGALRGGTLSFSGMSRFEANRQTWAITGGTGIYQAARGQIELRQVSNHETLVTVILVDGRR
jgi:Dirigent-like protein